MGVSRALIKEAIRGKRFNSGGYIRTGCPACEERTGLTDSKNAFSYSRTGMYVCWRCHICGWLPESDRDSELLTFQGEDEKPTDIIKQPEGFWLLGEGPGETALATQEARVYLHQRGVTTEQIRKHEIGACLSGYFQGRVIVPLKDDKGTWLWFVARTWAKKADRPYMYPKGAKGGMFFNPKALLEETEEPLIVVESVFDSIHVGDSAVAVMGKPNAKHVDALVEVKRPVVFILDGDAWEEAMCLSLQLRLRGCISGFVKLEPCQDPDEVDRNWLLEEARKSLS
jgi:hypothetical protein